MELQEHVIFQLRKRDLRKIKIFKMIADKKACHVIYSLKVRVPFLLAPRP